MNILVCYCAFTWPGRYAILDHIYCYERYSDHRVFYVNGLWAKFPEYLKNIRWDAIIFHNTYLIMRSNPASMARINNAFAHLKNESCAKIAIAQDEHNNTDLLCDFINEFKVDTVFSVAQTERDWDAIYRGHIPDDVRLVRCLPGYVEERRIGLAKRYEKQYRDKKDIDIGYRSFKAKARNGRVGVLKWKICDVIAEAAPRHGLKADVSVEVKDILSGKAWLKFIARSRYQAGVEGGSSLIDRDGSIRARCNAYEGKKPDATFEDIENACFPGKDNSLDCAMISPRVFEIAMAKCCQVLVEGNYNGIIKPGVHYIPIRKDFSDIDEVLAGLGDEGRRQRIIENAYRDLIESGKYSYARYVSEFFAQVADRLPKEARTRGAGVVLAHWINKADHVRDWAKLFLVKHVYTPFLPYWKGQIGPLKAIGGYLNRKPYSPR